MPVSFKTETVVKEILRVMMPMLNEIQQITDEQAESVNLEECDQFGNWKYIIRPNK